MAYLGPDMKKNIIWGHLILSEINWNHDMD